MTETVTKSKSCDAAPVTELEVIEALQQAGHTLMCLRVGGFHPGLAQRHWQVLPERFPGYVPEAPRQRIAAPSQEQIAEMDRVLGWVLIIPAREVLLRRVVNARCLMHPLRNENLYSWRRIAEMLGTDYRLVQRRHQRGIKIILEGLFKWITPGYENGSGAEMR